MLRLPPMPAPAGADRRVVVPVPAACVTLAVVRSVPAKVTSSAETIAIAAGAMVAPTAPATDTWPAPARKASSDDPGHVVLDRAGSRFTRSGVMIGSLVRHCPSQVRLVVHLGWEEADEAFVQSYLCQSPALVGTFTDTYTKEFYLSQALPASLLDVSEFDPYPWQKTLVRKHFP